MKKIIYGNPLFFAFLFPALADGIITLLGQGSQYWETARKVNEASPAYYFLLASPWLFITGSIVWFIFWYWLFKRLKEPVNLWLMFTFIAGHSWGSSSWIAKLIRDSGWMSNQMRIMETWGILVFYFALIGLVATYCLRIYIKNYGKQK